MKITRTSAFSGKTKTLDIPISQEQLDRYNAGEKIQNVAPQLTSGQREFILSGITDEKWDEMFAENE